MGIETAKRDQFSSGHHLPKKVYTQHMYAIGLFLSLILSLIFVSPAETRGQGSSTLTARDLIEAPIVGGGYTEKALAVSPDGSMVAFQVVTANIAENAYDLKWYVYSLTLGGTPRHIADGGDLMLNIRQRNIVNGSIVDAVAKWSPDGEWIAFARQTGEEIQIWRAHVRDGRVEQLTNNDANVFGSIGHDPLFEWSRDGSSIFYEVARSRETMANALEIEGSRGFLFDDRFHPGAQLTPTWSRCGQSRQGHAPLRGQACEPILWAFDFATASDRLALPKEVSEYNSIKVLYDQWIVNQAITVKRVFRDKNGQAATLENIDVEKYPGFDAPVQVIFTDQNGFRTNCDAAECIGSFINDIWVIRGEVVFLRRESESSIENFGFSSLYGWDPVSNHLRNITKTPDSYEGCAATLNELLCYHEGPTTPRRVVKLDIETGGHSVLFEPAQALAQNLTSRVEHLELETEDGRFAYAKLVYPTDYVDGQRYPLIIVQGHHRGFLEGGSGNEYPVHLFAQEGFFVLNASPYRQVKAMQTLSGEALGEYEFRTFRLRKNALAAYERYIQILDERALIDPSRVGITGLSSGSSNARYALIHSDLFAVSALSTGYSGPQQYWFLPSVNRQPMSRVYFEGALPFEALAEKYIANVQLGWHAREIDFPPILWQVSDSELSHAVFDHNLLYDEGQPVEMYVYPDAYHIKHQPVHRYNVYRRNVQWMKFWLQGETVSEPVDPEQYERWEKLCSAFVARSRASDRDSGATSPGSDRCLRAFEG